MGLMEQGDHVIMACRRSDACEAARNDLLARLPSGRCECRCLDLADSSSIRSFASDLQQSRPGLQITRLVNNAGVMGCPQGPGGEDMHWKINHLGTFLLTRLLLPNMAPHGRIVTVGSEGHRRGSLAVQQGPNGPMLEDIPPQGWSLLPTWYREYGRSKLGNGLMTAELSRRLQARGSSVTASCVSPGRVYTNILRDFGGVLGAGMRAIASNFFQTPAQGAAGVLRAATSPEFEGRHVPYIHLGMEAAPAAEALDPKLGANVWELTVRQAGLMADEDAKLWPKK